MDALSLLFFVLMALLSLVIFYFAISFFYLIVLNLAKAAVLFWPMGLGLPVAIFLELSGMRHVGLLLVFIGLVISVIWYPKKVKVSMPGIEVAALHWPNTVRGRILNRIDKAIARPGI